jgi:hypothetical protein
MLVNGTHGGYVAAEDAPSAPTACQGCARQRQCTSGWRSPLPLVFEALIRWALPAVRGDCRRRVRSRPHGGGVRPGRPTAGRRRHRVAGVTLARSVRGHKFRAAACCLLPKAAPGRPRVIRAAGVFLPCLCRARRRQEFSDQPRSAAAAYAPGRRTTGTGVLGRTPDVRTRTCPQRAGAAGHRCCRPVGSRSATVRRASDFPSAPHRSSGPPPRAVRFPAGSPRSSAAPARLYRAGRAARRPPGPVRPVRLADIPKSHHPHADGKIPERSTSDAQRPLRLHRPDGVRKGTRRARRSLIILWRGRNRLPDAQCVDNGLRLSGPVFLAVDSSLAARRLHDRGVCQRSHVSGREASVRDQRAD